MAVFVTLASGVLAPDFHDAVLKAIEEGSIDTWAYDNTTGFVHTAVSGRQQQWNQGAYLAYSSATQAADTIVKLYYQLVPNSKPADNTYGTLNGRFAGMLLNHFKELVKSIRLVDLRKN